MLADTLMDSTDFVRAREEANGWGRVELPNQSVEIDRPAQLFPEASDEVEEAIEF